MFPPMSRVTSIQPPQRSIGGHHETTPSSTMMMSEPMLFWWWMLFSGRRSIRCDFDEVLLLSDDRRFSPRLVGQATNEMQDGQRDGHGLSVH